MSNASYLTSSSLYKDSGDFLPNTLTFPLYIFNETVPSTYSWLFAMQKRVNSHSGLNQNPAIMIKICEIVSEQYTCIHNH